MARRSGQMKDTWKAKKWYNVYAPDMFGKQSLGEVVSNNPDNLVGRTMMTSLRDLTGDFSKSHVKLYFSINEVQGENAYTEFKQHELLRSYIRSQTRRNNTKLDNILDLRTKDGKKLRVTISAIAPRRMQSSQTEAVKDLIETHMKETASQMEMVPLIQELILGKITSDIYKKAKKIYPLRRVEVLKVKKLK
ncbi:MAG TPA: 30S ribosomal protein S3ae [Methanomicrobia archaeon]|nr:30S ribosomal protein S3ae [Methanomicrobia archaeon]